MLNKVLTNKKTLTLVIAMAAVYFIWGSTYLAIRFAVETMPPLLMIGSRFALAGVLLFGFMVWRGTTMPSARQWRDAAIAGTLLLGLGTGSVAWAEQYVASGLAAVLVTTVAIWTVLLDWLWKGRSKPNWIAITGLSLGIFGVGILVNPFSAGSSEAIHVPAALAIVAGAGTWAIGSLFARDADLPRNAFMSTALQMTAGGGITMLAGLALGEGSRVDFAAIAPVSLGAWGYLVIVGSLAGFSAFTWLMKSASSALVSTYVFVNPLVAVLLGWALAGELLGPRVMAASAFMIAAVIFLRHFSQNERRRITDVDCRDLKEPSSQVQEISGKPLRATG